MTLFNRILVLFSAFACSLAIAQSPQETVKSLGNEETVWVEFGIPVATNGLFANAIDEQILKTTGVGISGGWQPLKLYGAHRGLKGVLANFGITAEATVGLTSPFTNYLYSKEEPVTDVQTTCYSYDQYRDEHYWDGTCFRCDRNDRRSEYCQDVSVYGRDRYVKYESGSLAVGMKLPVKLADRLAVEGGTNVRLHFIHEGIQSDQLKTSTETSLGVTAGAVFKVSRDVSLTGTYEYAVKGRKYKAYQFGVRVNLGRYF